MERGPDNGSGVRGAFSLLRRRLVVLLRLAWMGGSSEPEAVRGAVRKFPQRPGEPSLARSSNSASQSESLPFLALSGT